MTRVLSPLSVRYVNGHYWVLRDPFVVELDALDGQRIVVPSLFVFDFNSVPRFFWRVAPPTAHGEAGTVHDYLCRTDSEPVVTREIADKAHLELMRWRDARQLKQTRLRRAARVVRQQAYYRALRLRDSYFHKKSVSWCPDGLVLDVQA